MFWGWLEGRPFRSLRSEALLGDNVDDEVVQAVS